MVSINNPTSSPRREHKRDSESLRRHEAKVEMINIDIGYVLHIQYIVFTFIYCIIIVYLYNMYNIYHKADGRHWLF